MGKRRSAINKNVISPHKGVRQLKQCTVHLPVIPKPNTKQLKSRYFNNGARRSIQDSATRIPTDLPIEDFFALHNLPQNGESIVSESDLPDSPPPEKKIELVPDIVLAGEIPDSSPVQSIMFAYIPDSDTG